MTSHFKFPKLVPSLSIDGIEIFVHRPDVNRAIRSDGGGGSHSTSRSKFPKLETTLAIDGIELVVM